MDGRRPIGIWSWRSDDRPAHRPTGPPALWRADRPTGPPAHRTTHTPTAPYAHRRTLDPDTNWIIPDGQHYFGAG